MLLRDARDEFFEAARSPTGADCLCCGRRGKVYKRKLNSGMVHKLVEIYRMDKGSPGEHFHVSKIFLEEKENAVAQEYSKLRFWGLLESSKAGYWGVTAKGIEFVEGKTTVPKYAIVFGNKCIGYSEAHTDIKSALGDKFDFVELMRGI